MLFKLIAIATKDKFVASIRAKTISQVSFFVNLNFSIINQEKREYTIVVTKGEIPDKIPIITQLNDVWAKVSEINVYLLIIKKAHKTGLKRDTRIPESKAFCINSYSRKENIL